MQKMHQHRYGLQTLSGATKRPAWTARAFEHSMALVVFALLSIAVSWPLAREFTTQITPNDDSRHNLWVLWHVHEWLLGRQPLFTLPGLYYPYGASLLTHGLGPVTGFFAFPFWPLGMEAAYNGAVLVSLTLTGYCMYLLAVDMELDQDIALFAGVMLLIAPMCLAGVLCHLTKVFLGGIPLTLLCLRRALSPARSPWWTITVGLGLLLLLLHAGYQFVLTSLAVGIYTLSMLLTASSNTRIRIFKRALLAGLACIGFIAPMLFAIRHVSTSGIKIAASQTSSEFVPDLVQFLLPYQYGLVFGPQVVSYLGSIGANLSLETAVWLPWLTIALAGYALWRLRRLAQPWALLLVAFVAISIGPQLKWAGHEIDLPFPMPYSLLVSLPGLDFMRVSGRAMMVGYVALAALAALGMQGLVRQFPSHRLTTLAVITAGQLALVWPQPWPMVPLPETPQFYRQLAADPEMYGVFDMPYQAALRPMTTRGYIAFSSRSQISQITHRKGIAAGYLSRTYAVHPLFAHLMNGADPQPSDLLVDGMPANGLADAEARLAQYGYRYVVVHRTGFDPEGTADPVFTRWFSDAFVGAVFGTRTPMSREATADVYAVDPAAPARTTLSFMSNWYPRTGEEAGWRWALSPARLYTSAPVKTPTLLEIVPSMIYDPTTPGPFGPEGKLRVTDADGRTTSVTITAGQAALVPIVLQPEGGLVTLDLEAGKFYPTAYGIPDPFPYSFAIQRIAVHTRASLEKEPDLLIDGQPQRDAATSYLLSTGSGWYSHEASTKLRWAAARAELHIYSPAARDATLQLLPVGFATSQSADFSSSSGVLRLRTARGEEVVRTAEAGSWITFPVSLAEGWNTVTVINDAGEILPSSVDPNNQDTRALGFAVGGINIDLTPTT